MVQDIAAKKLYNEYTNKRPAQTDYMVVFQQKKILARKLHGRICLPRLSDLLADGMKPGPEVGKLLNLLLLEVLEYPERNKREYLLERSRELRIARNMK